jgi:uncharacterized repeat protein (TIGR03803 family)
MKCCILEVRSAWTPLTEHVPVPQSRTPFFSLQGFSSHFVARESCFLFVPVIYGGAFGEGVTFELSKSGTMTVLHSFNCPSDGCYPIGGVTQDTKGNLYGAAHYGGSSGAYGTVWQLTP